jgi:hypothetical protein
MIVHSASGVRRTAVLRIASVFGPVVPRLTQSRLKRWTVTLRATGVMAMGNRSASGW